MRTDDELSIFSIVFDGNSSLLFGQGEDITLSCICYVCKLIKRHNPDCDSVPVYNFWGNQSPSRILSNDIHIKFPLSAEINYN